MYTLMDRRRWRRPGTEKSLLPMSGELCLEEPHFETTDGPCHPTSATKGAWLFEGHFFPAVRETSKVDDHQLEELTVVFPRLFVLKLLLTESNCIRYPCLALHVLVGGLVIGRLREGPEILEVLEDGDVRALQHFRHQGREDSLQKFEDVVPACEVEQASTQDLLQTDSDTPLRSSIGRRCVETESCNSISQVPVPQCVQNRRCRRLSLPTGGEYRQKRSDALAGHKNGEAVHEVAVPE